MANIVPPRKCAACNKAEGVYQNATPGGNIQLLCRPCRDRALKGQPAFRQSSALIDSARNSLRQKEHRRQKNRRRKLARGSVADDLWPVPGVEGDR